MRPPRPTLAASTALAVLMALFLLSGRWNLARVLSMNGSALTAPRVWLVALVLFVTAIPIWRPRRDVPPPVGILLFLGYFLITTLWAPDAALAGTKAVDLLVMFLGILCLRRLTVRAGVFATTGALWRVVTVIFGGFALLGLASSVLAGGGRLAILGGGPNVFGRTMGVLLVVSLAAVLDHGRARSVPMAGIIVSGLLIILTGSRGALAGTIVGVAGLLFMRRIQVGRTAAALAIVTAGLAIVAQWTAVGRAAIAAFEQRVLVLTLQQSYDSGRGTLREAALEMVDRSPWFGDGLNGFRARGHGVYPHNLELEALTDGGIVGLLVLLCALALPLLLIVARSRSVDPTSASVFLLHLACAQVSGDFYDSRGVFLFGMLLTLQFSQRRPARPRREPAVPTHHDRSDRVPGEAPPGGTVLAIRRP